MAWPPPAAADDVTRTVELEAHGAVTLRAARLWGSEVWIDDRGRVLCDGCADLIEPSKLLEPGSAHRPVAGLPVARGPLPLEDNPQTDSRSDVAS